MIALWLILLVFLFRLSFGVALAMGVTSSKLVTSGFFRVHLWVLMGVGTFAALVAWTNGAAMFPARADVARNVLTLAIGLAVISYVGAVIWMYERAQLGKQAIALIAGVTLLAGMMILGAKATPTQQTLAVADWLSSAVLLGSTTTAMLLGHWYLNTPTMKLDPLRRLLGLMAFAVAARAAISGWGLALEVQQRLADGSDLQFSWLAFLSLRWLAGIVAVAVLCRLTWLTLKIPNTQSATGILYTAVILVFIGELTSLLLSLQTAFPV